jgi:peptidoglycan/LPS O-acetylase OafA/YrhL
MVQHRLAYVDGLRGIAAFTVVISHFLCAFYPAFITANPADIHTVSGIEVIAATTPFNILYSGNLAVCIFFVISGYVLSYSYFSTGDAEQIYSSAFRRYPRLMIPVLATSLLFFAGMLCNIFPAGETAALTGSAWLKRMFVHEPGLAGMLWNIWVEMVMRYTVETPYNPVLWTIGHEIRGSFLVYLLLLLCGKRNARLWIYLLFAVLLIKSYYILFVAGMLLCDLQLKGRLRSPGYAVKIVLLLLACWLGSYRLIPAPGTWSMLDPLCHVIKPQAAAAIILFYVLMLSPRVQGIFTNRISRFLGDISYSMYLVHLLVICSFSCYLFSWLYGSGVSYPPAFCITLTTSSALIFMLSALIDRTVDRPGIRFSKWLYNRLFR